MKHSTITSIVLEDHIVRIEVETMPILATARSCPSEI
jgi:hypothetical protein